MKFELLLFENGFHFCDGDLLLLLKSCLPPLSILRRFSLNDGDLISGVGEGRFGPITIRDGSRSGFCCCFGEGFGDGVFDRC